MDLAELESICKTLGGIFIELVPENVELIAPSKNVERFGHNPQLYDSQSRLDYLYSMSDAELEELGVLDTLETATVPSWE